MRHTAREGKKRNKRVNIIFEVDVAHLRPYLTQEGRRKEGGDNWIEEREDRYHHRLERTRKDASADVRERADTLSGPGPSTSPIQGNKEPLNDKVQWTSRDVADSEPATSPRSENFTGPFNR